MGALMRAELEGVKVTLDGDEIFVEPAPRPELRAELRARKTEIRVLLETRRSRPDPDFRDVVPDPQAEAEALRWGWVQCEGNRWRFPPAWTAQHEPRQGPVRPLTDRQTEQVRTKGAPLPESVAYGQDDAGLWRRVV